MLTPFQLMNGDEVWINPVHVRLVRPDRGMFGSGGKGTEIFLGTETVSGLRVSVNHTPAAVAAALNKAMPAILDINAAIDDSSPPNRSSD